MASLQDRPNTALVVIDVQNGVVAGAHEHPGRCGERRCETRRNVSNQRPLTEGGEGKMCQKSPALPCGEVV